MCTRWWLLLPLCVCGDAFGWGAQGHEVIGAIADQLLAPNAAQQVQGHPRHAAARGVYVGRLAWKKICVDEAVIEIDILELPSLNFENAESF